MENHPLFQTPIFYFHKDAQFLGDAITALIWSRIMKILEMANIDKKDPYKVIATEKPEYLKNIFLIDDKQLLRSLKKIDKLTNVSVTVNCDKSLIYIKPKNRGIDD